MIKSIDLKDLYYAPLTQDDGSAVAYGAMTKISGAIKAKITPKSDALKVYSDGVLSDSIDYISSIEVELNLSDLDMPTQAALLGHTITGGVVKINKEDQAPWVGIAFRAMKSNKKWRYMKLLKGKFTLPDDETQTREDKLTAQTATIKGTFTFRVYDGDLQYKTDEDQTDYVPATGSGWFTTFGPTDTTPPTRSSITPTLNATGVAVGSTVVWVFSEAIQPGCVNAQNFFLVKDSDGSIVAGTLTLTVSNTTVTFTPGSNLTAAAVYRPVYTTGVKDLAGNAIAAQYVSKFTCA